MGVGHLVQGLRGGRDAEGREVECREGVWAGSTWKMATDKLTGVMEVWCWSYPSLKWSEVKVTQSCLTLFDPMDSSPWNSLGQNTGVGSLSLLQGIFPTQGSNPGLLNGRQILYQLNHQGSPRILEYVAYSFSSGSSQSRNRTGVSWIAGGFFTSWATSESLITSAKTQSPHNLGSFWHAAKKHRLCSYTWVLFFKKLKIFGYSRSWLLQLRCAESYYIYYLFYCSLSSFFTALWELSLVAASRGYSSLQWLLLPQSTGSRVCGLPSSRAPAQ